MLPSIIKICESDAYIDGSRKAGIWDLLLVAMNYGDRC